MLVQLAIVGLTLVNRSVNGTSSCARLFVVTVSIAFILPSF
jgi:hypothetical protein